MLEFRLTMDLTYGKRLSDMIDRARRTGAWRQARRIEVIVALSRHRDVAVIAKIFGLREDTVQKWARDFLIHGPKGLIVKKSPGRPPKLTKDQKRELARLIAGGPQAAGFPGGCWRSPMILELIRNRFGVEYNVHYVSQLLHNLGFSFQKARFVSGHLDPDARHEWKQRVWPRILRQARELGARIFFGDEASFPQWGTLNYTWAPLGQQPEVKTSGKRPGYKALALVEYGTAARMYYDCTKERLNSAVYQAFLDKVLSLVEGPVILIQDGASYHVGAAMRAFFAANADRLTVYQLPTYSPDFNPVERLWKQIKKDETHLIYFPAFDALVSKVEQALDRFANSRDRIKALFGRASAAA